MKKITLMAALIVATFTACSNYMDDEEKGRKTPDSYISFTPMEIQTIGVTRGAQTTTATITEYGVSSSIYPAANSYTSAGCGSYWFNEKVDAASGNSGHYWPGADYRVSFFAYAPYGLAALAPRSKNDFGHPVYQYTVPSAIVNQADFITAVVLDHSGEAETEPIPLTFEHQCTDIRFNIYNQGSDAITVHSIAMNGLKYSGTNTNGVWTLNPSVNSTSVNPFLLSLGTAIAGEATVDVTGTSNHFIMLPQTVASGTQVFDVDATVSGVRKHYYHTLTSDLVLQKGKSYTFKLTLGEGALIVDTETDIQDWEVEVKYLSIGGVSTSNTWTQPGVNDGQSIGVEDWEEE